VQTFDTSSYRRSRSRLSKRAKRERVELIASKLQLVSHKSILFYCLRGELSMLNCHSVSWQHIWVYDAYPLLIMSFSNGSATLAKFSNEPWKKTGRFFILFW
jgi:hypothetical protein